MQVDLSFEGGIIIGFSKTFCLICLSASVTFSEAHCVLLISLIAVGKHTAIKEVNMLENQKSKSEE